MARKKAFISDKAPAAIGPYSQAVKVGGMLCISGQLPVDPSTGEIIDGDITAQTKRVLENIIALFYETGMGSDDVVKTTVYLKDMEDFQAMNKVYSAFFKAPFPARSTVQVARLPKDALVEIDAIAYKA